MPEFQLQNISFDRMPAAAVPRDTLLALREVELAAMRDYLPVLSASGLKRFVGDEDEYVNVHRDPQLLVNRGDNSHYSVSRPQMAIAYEGDNPVGHAYSADVVSGTNEFIQGVKRYSRVANFRWLEMIAVHPMVARRGIATGLGYLSFALSRRGQPAIAYALSTKSRPMLKEWGFRYDDEIVPRRQTFVEVEGEAGLYGIPRPMYVNGHARGVARVIEQLAQESGLSFADMPLRSETGG